MISTVRELIEKLQTLNPDAKVSIEVVVYTPEGTEELDVDVSVNVEDASGVEELDIELSIDQEEVD